MLKAVEQKRRSCAKPLTLHLACTFKSVSQIKAEKTRISCTVMHVPCVKRFFFLSLSSYLRLVWWHIEERRKRARDHSRGKTLKLKNTKRMPKFARSNGLKTFMAKCCT